MRKPEHPPAAAAPCRGDFSQRGHLTVSHFDRHHAGQQPSTPSPAASAATGAAPHANGAAPNANDSAPQPPATANGAAAPHTNGAAPHPPAAAAPHTNGFAAPHTNGFAALANGAAPRANGAAAPLTVPRPQSPAPGAAAAAAPLSDGDQAAIAAFHARGLLDFLAVGDVSTGAQLRAVHGHLVSTGASQTKLIARLRVRPCSCLPLPLVISGPHRAGQHTRCLVC